MRQRLQDVVAVPIRATSVFGLTLAVALLAGIALRIWILAGPLGTLESDEAINGLIARRALHGNLTPIYWLSNYGGTQEALLTALVFAVVGSSTLALKLVPLTLFVAGIWLTWQIGKRLIGNRAAALAAALLWVWPPYFVWWTQKARAYYAFGLLCELLVLWLALRLRDRDSRLDALGLGLAAGLGWWATPEVVVIAVPAVAWLLFRRPDVLRRAWLGTAGFLVGAAPWFLWNARHGWLSLHLGAIRGEHTTYLGRLADLFRIVLPTWLGLRVPFSLDWLVGKPLGIAVLAACAVALAVAFVRRPPRLELLLIITLAFPFLYASSTFAYYVREPRYLVLFAPIPALLLAHLAAKRDFTAVASIAVALALSIGGLATMQHQDRYRPHRGGRAVPADISPLIRLLDREHVTRLYANYWLAYRISFETRERIVATSYNFVRDLKADRLVKQSKNPAYVFMSTQPRASLEALGYRPVESDGYLLYVRAPSS
jgi:4-amino-4-deoxy-L-arabinose transferase-like glycosyltransferase